jgi:hypothetical protein
MSIIGQGNLSPIEWIGILHGAVDPLTKGEPHQYIAQEGDHLELTASPDHKLNLEAIVDISRRAMSTIYRQWQENKIETLDWAEQTNEISDLTERLIEARVEKREHNSRRQTARKISALGSLFLIGIPFLWALKNNDKKFYFEIRQLKRHLKEPLSGIIFYQPFSDTTRTQTTPPPQAPPPQVQS